MSKLKKYACYWLSVTKSSNEPYSVHYALMDIRDLGDHKILISPERRPRFRIKLGKGKSEARADRSYLVSMEESSMEGFMMDVILREGHEKSKLRKYYANSKEHLIRYTETCFPEHAEAIKAALDIVDNCDIHL